jgi:hypothetical protein
LDEENVKRHRSEGALQQMRQQQQAQMITRSNMRRKHTHKQDTSKFASNYAWSGSIMAGSYGQVVKLKQPRRSLASTLWIEHTSIVCCRVLWSTTADFILMLQAASGSGG